MQGTPAHLTTLRLLSGLCFPTYKLGISLAESNLRKPVGQGLVTQVLGRQPHLLLPLRAVRVYLTKGASYKAPSPLKFSYYVLTWDKNSIPDPVKQESAGRALNEGNEGIFLLVPIQASGLQRMICFPIRRAGSIVKP